MFTVSSSSSSNPQARSLYLQYLRLLSVLALYSHAPNYLLFTLSSQAIPSGSTSQIPHTTSNTRTGAPYRPLAVFKFPPCPLSFRLASFLALCNLQWPHQFQPSLPPSFNPRREPLYMLKITAARMDTLSPSSGATLSSSRSTTAATGGPTSRKGQSR